MVGEGTKDETEQLSICRNGPDVDTLNMIKLNNENLKKIKVKKVKVGS